MTSKMPKGDVWILIDNDILKERILSLRAIEKGVPNDNIVV